MIEARRISLILAACVLAALASQSASATSNESIWAHQNVTAANSCVDDLLSHGIEYSRANESFMQAKQLYDAQLALEQRKGKANYNLVVQYSQETCGIRDSAIKASDELQIFLDEYNAAAERVDLSSMDKEYKAIMTAYDEERFEDAYTLIQSGYEVLASTEAAQTRIEVAYKATTQSITSFFRNHWEETLIVIIAAGIAIGLSWKAIQQTLIRRKLAALKMRKDSLLALMKKTQEAYFKYKKMSEIEFNVKMNTFKEMMRDLDRQFPIYVEQLAKIGGAKKVFK